MPRYCFYDNKGRRVSIRGNLGPHCANCADVAMNLCDYPIGEEKTCDRKICHQHSNLVGSDIHYCDAHFAIYKKENPQLFLNVINPFKAGTKNDPND